MCFFSTWNILSHCLLAFILLMRFFPFHFFFIMKSAYSLSWLNIFSLVLVECCLPRCHQEKHNAPFIHCHSERKYQRERQCLHKGRTRPDFPRLSNLVKVDRCKNLIRILWSSWYNSVSFVDKGNQGCGDETFKELDRSCKLMLCKVAGSLLGSYNKQQSYGTVYLPGRASGIVKSRYWGQQTGGDVSAHGRLWALLLPSDRFLSWAEGRINH